MCGIKGCKEVVTPFAYISSVTEDNLVTIKFTEPVTMPDYKKFIESLKVSIVGPATPYKFSYEVLTPKETISKLESFSEMQIKVNCYHC